MRKYNIIALGIAAAILLATFNSVVGMQSKVSNVKTSTPLYSIRISDALERKEKPNINYVKKYDKISISLPKLQESIMNKFTSLIKNNEHLKEMLRNIIRKGKLSSQMMMQIIKKLSKNSIPSDMFMNLKQEIAVGASPNWTPLTFLICWYINIWAVLILTAIWSCFAFC